MGIKNGYFGKKQPSSKAQNGHEGGGGCFSSSLPDSCSFLWMNADFLFSSSEERISTRIRCVCRPSSINNKIVSAACSLDPLLLIP